MSNYTNKHYLHTKNSPNFWLNELCIFDFYNTNISIYF